MTFTAAVSGTLLKADKLTMPLDSKPLCHGVECGPLMDVRSNPFHLDHTLLLIFRNPIPGGKLSSTLE